MVAPRLALPFAAWALGLALLPVAALAQPAADAGTAPVEPTAPTTATAPEGATQPATPPATAPSTSTSPTTQATAVSPGTSERRSGEHAVPVEALLRYHRARASYERGRYSEAARELEAAYALDPSGANLLFNLGVVYERLGDLDHALRAYRRYQARTADPSERARTERILTRLRGARVELATRERRHGRADAVFWLTTGASLAGLSIGVTWLATQSTGSDELPAVAFTVGGAALGALAAVLYFAREAPAPVSLTATLSPHGPGLGLAATF